MADPFSAREKYQGEVAAARHRHRRRQRDPEGSDCIFSLFLDFP